MPTPHNPAWTASDLAADSGWRLSPSAAQLAELVALVAGSAGRPYDALDAEALPPGCRSFLAQVTECLDVRYGVCLIQGLPVGDDTDAARRLCFALGLGLGTPVFQDTAGGRLSDIRGTGAYERSGAATDRHRGDAHFQPEETGTALPHHSDPSDVAGLLCIRPAAVGGTSTVSSALAVHACLEREQPELLRVLYEPIPYGQSPSPGGQVGWIGLPVFGWHDGYFKCHVVPDLIRAGQAVPEVPRLSAQQQAALQALQQTAARPDLAVRHRLQPGELLLVDNHLVLHGRDAYQDRAEQQRHMLRLWLATPTSRPLDPVHAGWIGDPSAGALRGGIMPERLPELRNRNR